ncbi:uncharacterized protein A4U43_C10F4860 [Asparagus officinalis]|uniref:Uncharacterized protein n=1 Tax=Asparagus officinalis TaxID=4686 RepID=A0A5P1E0Q9_ASPOF|nr:uncharacterized protein A4U43_C10F4860 [Asparagus officinalis]
MRTAEPDPESGASPQKAEIRRQRSAVEPRSLRRVARRPDRLRPLPSQLLRRLPFRSRQRTCHMQETERVRFECFGSLESVEGMFGDEGEELVGVRRPLLEAVLRLRESRGLVYSRHGSPRVVPIEIPVIFPTNP